MTYGGWDDGKRVIMIKMTMSRIAIEVKNWYEV